MAEEPNLPDQETFTREELSQRWKCDTSKIDAYIRSGQLKQALPPPARHALREWIFYQCTKDEPLSDVVRHAKPIDADDSNEWLLDLIEDGEPLEKYVGKVAQEKIISRPEYFYVPNAGGAIIKAHGTNGAYQSARFFYDLHGNPLIPIWDKEDGYQVCFVLVKKRFLDSLIVPLEEVKRFECENNIGQKSKRKSSGVIDRQEEKPEQKQEDSNSPPPPSKTANEEKPLSSDERLLRLSEVHKRVGISKSQIYNLMNAGKFPKPIKLTEKIIAWPESVIDEWIEEKKKGK